MIKQFILKKHIKKAIKNGLTIGKNYYIHSRVDFGSEPYLITIGDNVRLTQGVKFVTHDGGVYVLRKLYPELKDIDVFGKIIVGNNVHIGMNTIIMPGVTVGDNVVIGCGAVVTKDIPSNSVATGVPAKVIETLDEYKSKILEKCVHTHNLSAKEKKLFLLNNGNKNEKDY